MDKSEIESRVKRIIVEHLGVEGDKVTPSARLDDDLGADSLDAVELVMAVEEELTIQITDEQAKQVETVEQLINLAAEQYEAQKFKE